MQVINMKVKDLIPYEKNPRKNDKAVQYVKESIKQFDFRNPILVDKNNVVICGHTRLKAAKELKLETVPVIIASDLSDEQVKALRLADNKVAEKAEWDFDLLSEELKDILEFNMEDFGFEFDFDEEPMEVQEDDFEIEVPEEPKAKLGDIYQLGNHRLMCGDSTQIDQVLDLLGGGAG